jgi:hypothetical protein
MSQETDPPPRRRGTRIALVFAVVATVVGLPAVVHWFSPPDASSPDPSVSDSTSAHEPDWHALRAKAWDKVQPRLSDADRRESDQVDDACRLVATFFDGRKQRTPAFAKKILSMRGKWPLLKQYLPGTDPQGHFKFLMGQFEELVFSPDELRQVTESAIRTYVSTITGLENETLVKIRADLTDSELNRERPLPVVQSDAIFRTEYGRMVSEVMPAVTHDLGVDVARFIGVWVAADAAVMIAERVAAAVAARMGVTSVLAGAGATSGWATFGVGLVACVVLDIAVDWLLKLTGYDPESKVAARVDGTLDNVCSRLIEGDPEAWKAYRALRILQRDDPVPALRKRSGEVADRIDASGNLGLRRELTKLHDVRARVRRAALERLILQGDGP